MRYDAALANFTGRGLSLSGLHPLVDGEAAAHGEVEAGPQRLTWPLSGALQGARFILDIEEAGPGLRLRCRLDGLPHARPIHSLGLGFEVLGRVDRYLRNGYTSWDGSFFVRPGTSDEGEPANRLPSRGHAMTALVPADGAGAVILGFTRHDRFQSLFRFDWRGEALAVCVETLHDLVPHAGRIEAEPLILFDRDHIEDGMRVWDRAVAAEIPGGARVPAERITGWCSWYNLYGMIDEASIRAHLEAAKAFRDRYRVPLTVFQIDDGFTPEMGDWLEVRPQFPGGMKPVVEEIEAAGFTPGLWIAPFMVGNRSKLFQAHPDWVVQDVRTGRPLTQMTFYGEVRWFKRSEEYYILDITHPEAEAYMREVFRTWRRDWGARYFKTDFMLFGSEHGPDRARWHAPGLSRIAIWRRMGELIREEIGDGLWLGCGCPIWASVGQVDAVRISRDVGVAWKGDQSAEGLLRDLITRNHAGGILWQADPDCILLRERFHELSDDQVRSLALFAGLSGGVLMTSDKLDELPEARARLFASLLNEPALVCDMPSLERGAATFGQASGVVATVAHRPDSSEMIHLFNMGAEPRMARFNGLEAQLGPHASALWNGGPGFSRLGLD